MAQRSVQIVFANQTREALSLVSSNLQHGIWSQNPPQTIQPNSTSTFGSESNGFATGTTGDAIYSLQSNPSGLINLSWDNPFEGSDSFPPAGAPAGFSIATNAGDGGNNATVTYTLTAS